MQMERMTQLPVEVLIADSPRAGKREHTAGSLFSREPRMAVVLNVNGRTRNLDIDPNTPLLWAIRDDLGLTGTKYGCGVAQCGACTVHVDGEPLRSCSAPVSAVGTRKITTIEGLGSRTAKAVQKAWVELD